METKDYPKVIQDLLTNYFGSSYLSVIALVQGIAIFMLIDNFGDFYYNGNYTYLDYSLLFFEIIIIFACWHHYVLGIIYLRWIPDWRDTVIPLFLGISEISLIKATFPVNIYEQYDHIIHLILMVLFIFASLAYFNAAFRNNTDFLSSIIRDCDDREQLGLKIKFIHKLAASVCMFIAILNFILFLCDCKNGNFLSTLVGSFLLFLFYEIYYSKKIKPLFFKQINK